MRHRLDLIYLAGSHIDARVDLADILGLHTHNLHIAGFRQTLQFFQRIFKIGIVIEIDAHQQGFYFLFHSISIFIIFRILSKCNAEYILSSIQKRFSNFILNYTGFRRNNQPLPRMQQKIPAKIYILP